MLANWNHRCPVPATCLLGHSGEGLCGGAPGQLFCAAIRLACERWVAAARGDSAPVWRLLEWRTRARPEGVGRDAHERESQERGERKPIEARTPPYEPSSRTSSPS